MKPVSVLFQSAKLGDRGKICAELAWAQRLLDESIQADRVYGNSGGALPALAYTLARAARMEQVVWGKAANAIDAFDHFLSSARGSRFRRFNLPPTYGRSNLKPLRHWLENYLSSVSGRADWLLSELPLPLYLACMDKDAVFILFGPPDARLQCQYQFMQVGPPRDAPLLDALIASLSTMLSTAPQQVNGAWYRDCRPAIVDAGALVADLESSQERALLRFRPHAPIRRWRLNAITSSMIMLSQNERNQTLLASYYLDLLRREEALDATCPNIQPSDTPSVTHIQLPYVGSTEAATNMRQSVARKAELMDRFHTLLEGQLDDTRFNLPSNVIYGAGGFSGILAGLVTTRAIQAGFAAGGGELRQIYGVSAGVLNGFFHAVAAAVNNNPELYQAPAQRALDDLEAFLADIAQNKLLMIHKNPFKLLRGVANLDPLRTFLRDRLRSYTGITDVDRLTFDDLHLPLTVAVARSDGFTDFLGMTQSNRRMHFAGREIKVLSAPVLDALIAGWSMNTYIIPAEIHGQTYQDGGGAFYDIGLFAACLDAQMINQINIHLDEPEGHSYNLPERPDLVRILFDSHNFYFPEERRRMFCLTNLLYQHYRRKAGCPALVADFHQDWRLDEEAYGVQ